MSPKTDKPKYPIRVKTASTRCTDWDGECPASARLILARIGVRYYG